MPQRKMHLFIIIVVVVAVAIALATLKTKTPSRKASTESDAYYLKKSLFSPAERSLFGVLETLGYEGVTIVSKVRLADIFGLRQGLALSDRLRALNRISAKHVDFLLIQSSDGRPLLGIELDDISHEGEERVARDLFVNSVFSSAGLPILHIVAKAAYDPREIHRQIETVLAGGIVARTPQTITS